MLNHHVLMSTAAESLNVKDLIYIVLSKSARRLTFWNSRSRRFVWTYGAVADASGPELILRNYLEQRDLRKYLQYIRASSTIRRVADIGCGFGRLEMLLGEFAGEVVGFEREAQLVETARVLLPIPGISFVQTENLAELPSEDLAFDLVLIVTVLQHLTDAKATAVIEEAKRITSRGGWVLLCEQTDESDILGNIASESELIQRGRSIAIYESLMKDFSLIKSSERINEPTYARKKIGSYMLFRKPI